MLNKALLFLAAVFICCVICNTASCKNPEYDASGEQSYDPDLTGWKTASWAPFLMDDKITGFAYGEGRYVVISQNEGAISEIGKIAWSNDGDIWKKANIPQELSYTAFKAVCYGETASGGRFVVVGDNGCYAWSSNGENWIIASPVEMNGFGANGINGIAFGAGLFVAVGNNKRISYSPDGISWTASDTMSFPTVSLNDVTYDSYNGCFYVVGNGGNRGWTENPAAWNYRAPEAPIGSENIIKVTAGRYAGETGIGILYGSPARFAVAINPGFNFNSDLDRDIEQFLFADYNYAMNGIAWGSPSGDGNGNFVVAGACAMIGYWPSAEPSKTGDRFFRAISFPDFKKWEISALEACNGRFFIGNVDGKIGYSK
jgi:hypothetical protein